MNFVTINSTTELIQEITTELVVFQSFNFIEIQLLELKF